MAKKSKPKISKLKRTNHTTNKMKKAGKLKLQRHKQKLQKQKQPLQKQIEYSSESEESTNEWADMLDDEEQKYILTRLAKQPQLLSNVPEEEESNKQGKKRKRSRVKVQNQERDSGAETDMEEKYEQEQADKPVKKLRPLLPIKTKEGIVQRAEEMELSDTESNDKDKELQLEESGDEQEHQESGDEVDPESDSDLDPGEEEGRVVTTVELLAERRNRLQHEKLRIGALCSSLLESPEKKLKNLYPILYLMEDKLKDGSLNLLSVRKLATVSAAEVFSDILPEYRIRHQDYSDIKLKKDTLALYKFEKELLEFYKRYLVRVEKAANLLRKKKGDNRKLDPPTTSLALLSLRSMCSLLEAKPNFNFSTNIAQSVVPFLDSPIPEARSLVTECCCNVFKEDRKGEITLDIVRLINQLVKRRGERLQPTALDCLLSLKIADVQLDAESDIKMKKKQDEKHKKRIVNLSKKEKKRAKKLKEVERELLETEAKENETARLKQLTEVTRLAFHIYFRLLKTAPRSKLLIAVLQGLAKFTHVINLEYYSDLVAILTQLVRDELVDARSRLLCVRTVLAMLSGAGDALNIDPHHFHDHLYASALTVHAASNDSENRLVLEAISAICGRARRVSASVLLAFSKRLGTLAIQQQHHAALAALTLLHQLVQQSKSVSSLLDTEEIVGSGRFDPFAKSPEHCAAHAATLYELSALSRHYHPTTVKVANAILAGGPLPNELLKMSPLQIFDNYNCSQMAFKPAIPPPAAEIKRKSGSDRPHVWTQQEFKTHCLNVEENVEITLDNVT
ncbi:nucleolar complex protein 3 homolog [Pieris napi]|uniref:nucleolar complex protein 3 homolog n=1 Tax=Pieris napi TaxID=78633 RepID=UPI001FB9DDFB|nr:nucleolar complex protein 3 homolog [Pieris napi]